MISANDLKPGVVFEHKNSIWKVLEYAHVKPGKGPAFVRLKSRDLRSGAIIEETSRTDAKFERVRVEGKSLQFLYSDEHTMTFMDTETYEQAAIGAEIIGDDWQYLTEGMEVTVTSHEGAPMTVILPKTLTRKVTEAAPQVTDVSVPGNLKVS